MFFNKMDMHDWNQLFVSFLTEDELILPSEDIHAF